MTVCPFTESNFFGYIIAISEKKTWHIYGFDVEV